MPLEYIDKKINKKKYFYITMGCFCHAYSSKGKNGLLTVSLCFCVIVAGDVYTIVMLVKSENKNTKSTFKYTFLYEIILLSCYQVIRKTFIFLAIFNLS